MSVSNLDSSSRPVKVSREAKRVPTFDGLRGVCAVALLVVHVAWTASLTGSYTAKPSNLPAAIVINGFQITVGVFFLLSGLFLFRPFARAILEGKGAKGPALGPYFVRRVLRLIPAYLLVTTAALLLLNFSSINSVWYVLRPFALMQNYDFKWMAGMDITWTVPTEIQWYIALPLIAALTGLWARRGATVKARARRLIIPVPILILVGFGWMAYIHRPSMGQFPPEFWWPVGVAANFGAGLALGIMSAHQQVDPNHEPVLFRWARKRPNLMWLGALVVFALNCWNLDGRPGYGDYATLLGSQIFYVLFILFCTFMVLPMVAPGAKSRLIDAALGNPVIVFLGRISYGLYLYHFVVMNLYLRNGSIFGGEVLQVPFLRGKVGFWELESAVLGITIVVAAASYYLFERPILNLGERKLQAREARRKVATIAPTSATEGPGTKAA